MTETGIRDEAAYQRVVDRYAPLVRARCARALGDADGDDATQAVFLVLWRRRADAPADGPALASWLYRTTGFVIGRALRDRARRRRAEGRARRADMATLDEPSAIELDEVRRALDAALAELPRAEREAVLLTQLAGHSYAEVAEAQRCAKSTVAARVDAGLDALRRLLTRRGVALSAVGLAALVAGEADAAVPDALVARLHRLPAATTTGTTMVVVAARILSWSEGDVPIMKIIGVSAAALVCGVSCWLFLGSARAAETTTAVATARAASSSAAPSSDGAATPADAAFDRQVEAMRCRQLELVRWYRPADGWRRLLETPIGLVIQATTAAAVTEALAGIERIDLRLDPTTTGDPGRLAEEERRDARGELLDAAALKRWRRGLRDDGAAKAEPERIPSIGVFIAFPCDVDVRAADPAVIARVRGALAGGLGGRVPFHEAEGALVADGDDARAVVETDAGGVHVRVRPTWVHGELEVPAAALDWPADGDVELRALAVPRDPVAFAAATAQPLRAAFVSVALSIAVVDGRVRFASRIDRAIRQPSPATPAIPLDAAAWDAVPADAVAAGAVAMHGDGDGAALVDALVGLVGSAVELSGSGERSAAVDAIVDAVDASEGVAVGYLASGGVVPALTLSLPCPDASAGTVIDRLRRFVPAGGDAGATSVRLRAGPIAIEIGRRDGRLIASTDPRGIAAFASQPGAFAGQPDVAAGLAASALGTATAHVLVRADRVIDLALPLAATAGGADATARLQAAAKRIADDRQAGWLVVRCDRDGSRAEAGGAVALIAAMAAAFHVAGVTGVN